MLWGLVKVGCPLVLVLALTAATPGSDVEDIDTNRQLEVEDLETLSWRSIGPANMAGRIAALALAPGDSKKIYLGYATGGLWKSTNRGTTFSPIFDEYETASIGSLAVCDAPNDWAGWADEAVDEEAEEAEDEPDPDRGKAKIIWVGTGEGNGRNSSSWGHGVYRSTDGGGSFEHLGLEETHDIPALAVDPNDPDVCFIAALGHLWGPNDERGVYRTLDGGKTWQQVLHIDENTGACDVMLDPTEPEIVYAAMYHRRRAPWSYQSGGPEGGIYRSLDRGATWTKLRQGLPEQTGRIGLALCESSPEIVMAVLESDVGGKVGNPFANRSRAGGVFRSHDRGTTWTRVSDFAPRSFYFSRIEIDPVDPDRVYLLGWGLAVSDDGGTTFRGTKQTPHVDYHAMVIDPDDTDHLLIGNDGGLYVSWDRGKTWDFHNHMAVGQFYNVAVDDSDPYRVGGGLQDNGSWIGPSETITEVTSEWMGRKGAITNNDWMFVAGGDGFHVAFDPVDPNIVYAESQGGWINRVHLDTGERYTLRPSEKEGEQRFRFNWNAPFFISPHDHTRLYLGGNHVFRLTDRGEQWERISDDLSTRDPDKIMTVGSDAETAGTIVSLAESPVEPGILWAGTDDGLVHVTTDDGGTWAEVTPSQVAGLYVSSIEASHHDARTAYVAVDGHRSDVFDPILMMTDDLGQSWKSIVGDLPPGGPPEVVREDPKNPNVLYVGTETGCYVTIDGGDRWLRLNGDTLPTVAVDDLKIQAREHDLVAGTHGRSIWVLDDVSPLSQLSPEIIQSPFHVFESQPGQPRYKLWYGGLWSDRMFIAGNPPMGAVISYWLRDWSHEDVSISIAAAPGNGNGTPVVVRNLTGPGKRGLNRVVWDLQPEEAQRLGNPHNLPEFVTPGEYKVTVSWGEHSESTTLDVLGAPRSGDRR